MTDNQSQIPDARQREQALDPARSFIVQAPAGAGKTELLIQRYLTLLGTVAAPEEIIAITFTRKAAAEMRSRVIQALERGKNSKAPEHSHEQKTWHLAGIVLARDSRCEWGILDNPQRLKIQTIDSLCAGLTRQMPYLSGFGGQPDITDRPEALYREAARNTVAALESGARWSGSIAALIRHLDNHLPRVEALVGAMLARRDQWLRHMHRAEDMENLRARLEQALVRVIEAALEDARQKFPGPGQEILFASLAFAVNNLKKDGKTPPVASCEGLTDLPAPGVENVDKWLGLADFLLTAKGEWRKTVTVKNGFPAPSSAKTHKEHQAVLQEAKAAFLDYLETLSSEDAAADALHRVRMLPDPAYPDDQWDILKALFEILKVAVGHLELVFQEAGAVDFAEIALRADAALGKPENPTDLSLAMDYRICHILMDEFQDTSFTQYALLEQLTAGWTPGDGRTFFAVGDPMQSIYGFREAEVGLFLNAWENGLGQVPLIPLVLRVNFRSRQGIIEWVNAAFPKVMPRTADIATGRVPYARSRAFHSGLDGDSVVVHPFVPADREKEAARVAACVKKARKKDPCGTLAILVRGRSHLVHIVNALKAENIKFQAVEIDSLENRQVITDLMALARAIAHPGDRIAWLAVLRAPWCGLLLRDLYALAGKDPHQTLMELMHSHNPITCLTPDGQHRLKRVGDILTKAVENRLRQPFRTLVQGVWIALGGPACVTDPREFEDAEVFFDLLDQQAGMDLVSDISALEAAAAALFARPAADADPTLQIMTIHKAKGLEFDTVILPGLERRPPPASYALLQWLERAAGHDKDLLLAPISETGSDNSKIYQYIRKVHEEKRGFEDGRLLYVAATRARKYLHVMGGVTVSSKSREVKKPPEKTLLHSLWPAVGEIFYRMHQAGKQPAGAEIPDEAPEQGSPEIMPPVLVPVIRRLKPDWDLPRVPGDVIWTSGGDPAVDAGKIHAALEFDWAGETARIIGVVVHAWLKMIAETDVARWDGDRIHGSRDFEKIIARDLARWGVREREMEAAVMRVTASLVNAVTDPVGRWILGNHKSSACEYGLTGRVDGQNMHQPNHQH